MEGQHKWVNTFPPWENPSVQPDRQASAQGHLKSAEGTQPPGGCLRCVLGAHPLGTI